MLNDKTKEIYWWNRNYFFVGTLLIIGVNILLFWLGGDSWQRFVGTHNNSWNDCFNVQNLLRVFLESFAHVNWQHVLLNMLCFLFVGLYLERRIGTFGIVSLVISMAFFTGLASTANSFGFSIGYSGVNYGLYAYVLVDYIFSFFNEKKSKSNIIFGAIILILIYVFMCFKGGTTGFEFEFYPYDLLYNMGHYSAIITGAILAITIKVAKIRGKKE